jgi:hypothetical protein
MSLSILFTNHSLDARRGSELWVLDVCRALIRRGYRPAAFSLELGAVAEEIRLATVPVVNDLDKITFTPDLIHGHHHLETLIAALHFPDVPIVHFCHGFLPWEETPLVHPSVMQYVAVDAPTAERLTTEGGIPADRVEQLWNFVDLVRFAPRPALPARPRRALVLSNQAEATGYVAVIREACQQCGIEVEVAGLRSGRVLERVADQLQSVDVAFAKGRSALEAMAVGCPVILADVFGAGPLVTEAAFDSLRRQNFGIRLLGEPHSVAWYRSQLAGYDVRDAACVSARVRQTAGLEQAVDRLLEIYQRALVRWRAQAGAADDRAATRAASRHLSAIAGRLKRVDEARETAAQLSAELTAAQRRNEQLAVELRESRSVVERQRAEAATEACAKQELESRLERSQQHLATYESLATIRLRNALVRVPLVGDITRAIAAAVKSAALNSGPGDRQIKS